MANYYGTTASSGALVKLGQDEALREYLAKWGFMGEGDIDCLIREATHPDKDKRSTLHIYGQDDFGPIELDADGEFPDDCDSDSEKFLEGLVPFLDVQSFTDYNKEKCEFLITVQTVGNEKCRFPLGAAEWTLLPDGSFKTSSFKSWSTGL